MHREQGALRLSALVTFLLALFGIGFGLMSRSGAIIFDGVYSLLDTVTALLMLLVARLLATATGSDRDSRLVERFTMGFWHLEPIVVGLSGMMLMGSASYALITAIDSLLKGGRVLIFDLALFYAFVTLVTTLTMSWLMRRSNRRLNSGLIAIDVTGWLISAALSGALLLAFGLGWLVQGTELDWITPYIDPGALALVALLVLPVPVPMLRRALSEILLLTPADLKARVDQVANEAVTREGFLSYRAYVAQVGRGTQVELYFIVPRGQPARPLEDWDAIRDRLGAALGGAGPNRWLTIAFTTDQDWAE